MALLIETLRNAYKTSLYGRRIGLDANDYIVGPPGMRVQVEDITTTAATSASPFGITRVLTSGSSQTGSYTLQAPIVGVTKTLLLNSTSTGGQQFTMTGATVYNATAGTSSAVVNLYAPGASVQLTAVATDRWIVTGGNLAASSGTSASFQQLVTFTTST